MKSCFRLSRIRTQLRSTTSGTESRAKMKFVLLDGGSGTELVRLGHPSVEVNLLWRHSRQCIFVLIFLMNKSRV